MKENKSPRGKTPSLIGSANGRPKRIIVQKKSECKRCHCDILVGHDCFGIPKATSSFGSIRRFCKECFYKIIEQTRVDLEELKTL